MVNLIFLIDDYIKEYQGVGIQRWYWDSSSESNTNHFSIEEIWI